MFKLNYRATSFIELSELFKVKSLVSASLNFAGSVSVLYHMSFVVAVNELIS